jgi:hypothetical protein
MAAQALVVGHQVNPGLSIVHFPHPSFVSQQGGIATHFFEEEHQE